MEASYVFSKTLLSTIMWDFCHFLGLSPHSLPNLHSTSHSLERLIDSRFKSQTTEVQLPASPSHELPILDRKLKFSQAPFAQLGNGCVNSPHLNGLSCPICQFLHGWHVESWLAECVPAAVTISTAKATLPLLLPPHLSLHATAFCHRDTSLRMSTFGP